MDHVKYSDITVLGVQSWLTTAFIYRRQGLLDVTPNLDEVVILTKCQQPLNHQVENQDSP